MSARYVMHDGARWRVVGEIMVDDDPGFELRRRVNGSGPARMQTIIARAVDCTPDVHQPRRVIRADGVVMIYSAGVVTLREKGRRKGHATTLRGLYQAVAWQAARIRQRDTAFKRRTRRAK